MNQYMQSSSKHKAEHKNMSVHFFKKVVRGFYPEAQCLPISLNDGKTVFRVKSNPNAMGAIASANEEELAWQQAANKLRSVY
ncbi:hypothetical protein ACMYR3_15820 [Ampullimonas aquatilis]|uniref:hypothetical protein n=1 Tax=Ampullimonas aquatilis TaxID=1341549 RepID=UPI003C780EF7